MSSQPLSHESGNYMQQMKHALGHAASSAAAAAAAAWSKAKSQAEPSLAKVKAKSRIVVQVIYGPAELAQPALEQSSSHILHFEVLAKLIGAKEKVPKELESEMMKFEMERWIWPWG
uniref:GG23217 n=1 Tax=Drosophila erecta TaxID=7220 RepID=B3P353_DROER